MARRGSAARPEADAPPAGQQDAERSGTCTARCTPRIECTAGRRAGSGVEKMTYSIVDCRFAAACAFAVLPLLGCGSGDELRRLTPLEQHIYLEPTPVPTTLAFDRIATGYPSSCMLTAAGDAWCWG